MVTTRRAAAAAAPPDHAAAAESLLHRRRRRSHPGGDEPPAPLLRVKTPPAAAGRSPGAAAAASSGTPALKTFDELRASPRWHYLADNKDIHTGYRAGLTLREAAWSLFSCHNESFNVWSHGLGALFFAAMLASFVVYELPEHVREDMLTRIEARVLALGEAAGVSIEGGMHGVPTWPLAVFMVSAVVCLTSSAAFHLLAVVDEAFYVSLAALDYSGIGILIFGSTFPMLWPLGFWCHPALGALYLACGSLLALGTVVVSTAPAFRTAEYRLVRMGSFIATGSFGAIPFAHLWLLGEPLFEGALPRLLQMGALYLVGALLYGFRVPERLVPGRLDVAFNSHNIFHLCVWAAAAVHYHALFAHYAWRVAHSACPGGASEQ